MSPIAPAPSPSAAPPLATRVLALAHPEATEALGMALAAALRPGETVLLDGAIGAGKSHLARALIQAAFRAGGAPAPDVPSPTYTLVQPYAAPGGEIVHADLYRLGDTSELEELGLSDAFGSALCLVEWPDRLGAAEPPEALRVALAAEGAGRRATLTGPRSLWGARLAALPDPAAGGRPAGDDPGAGRPP